MNRQLAAGGLMALGQDSLSSAFWVIMLCGGVLVLLVFGFIVATWVRKWVNQDERGPVGPGFTLGDMRRLQKEGKITPEEFERARGAIVAAAQKVSERAKTTGNSPPDDIGRGKSGV